MCDFVLPLFAPRDLCLESVPLLGRLCLEVAVPVTDSSGLELLCQKLIILVFFLV